MFYGLTIMDVRQLIYEVAMLNNVKVPEKWHETKVAGIKYLYNLRKRDNRLSLRTLKGYSLRRATSFNHHNFGIFFDNLKTVMSRHAGSLWQWYYNYNLKRPHNLFLGWTVYSGLRGLGKEHTNLVNLLHFNHLNNTLYIRS